MHRQNADTIGGGIFLIGLGILFLTDWFWPGILALIGVVALVNQTLRGEPLIGLATLVFFGGLTVLIEFNFDWMIIVPVGLIAVGVLSLANNFFHRK